MKRARMGMKVEKQVDIASENGGLSVIGRPRQIESETDTSGRKQRRRKQRHAMEPWRKKTKAMSI
jgi:hypothetical protein